MDLTVTRFDIPLKAPFRIATGELTTAHNVLVAVDADGVTGFGEACPFPPITGGTQQEVLARLEALKDTVARAPLGAAGGTKPRPDPRMEANAHASRGRSEDLHFDGIASLLDGLGAPELPCDARNALDVAAHDHAARTRGVPLAEHLGGRVRPFDSSVTVPIVALEEVAGVVERALDAGFRVLKVKSRSGVETESERIGLVRDLAPDAEVRVDANAGWSLAEAKRMLPVLSRHDVAFCEQPLDRLDLAGHAELRRLSILPIMVDESVFTLEDAKRVVAAKAADLVNVKLAKSGGLTEASRILRYAEEEGIDCMVGCMIESRIGISAGAHLAAAHPAVKYVDLDGHTFLRGDPVEGGVRLEKGRVVFGEGPGHGAVPGAAATEGPLAERA